MKKLMWGLDHEGDGTRSCGDRRFLKCAEHLERLAQGLQQPTQTLEELDRVIRVLQSTREDILIED